MSKTAIVYWSGTGNTEAMANCIAEGVKDAGGDVTLFTPGEFSADKLGEFDTVAFGCPSMGAEQLEDGEFEPMFTALESALSGRKIALFGSYGWGDGQWMREWCERCTADGADLYDEEGLICIDAPADDARDSCKELGRKLASW